MSIIIYSKIVTKGLHQLVPEDVFEEAEQFAKVREMVHYNMCDIL